MKLGHFLAGIFFLLLAGCGSNGLSAVKSQVMVEIVNQSSRDFENAEARFGRHTCEWGWVVRATSKGYGFYPHPITTETELHWDEPGGHRVEKLDLKKIYPPGKSGRLTFTVYDGRVEVSFREKS